MSARLSILRRLALGFARHAALIMPPARSSWAEAMQREVQLIEDDRAALRWAVGSALASYVERVRAMDLLQTRWAGGVLAIMALWRALTMFFAPGLTIAYRMHELGVAEVLGSRTPGDDYRRFIPLMDASPNWLLGLEIASGLFYLLTAWGSLRKGRSVFVLFAAALLLEIAAASAVQFVPGLTELTRQAFTFTDPNIRRDYLLPVARIVLLVVLGTALWLRSRSRHAQGS
jgi:hypothetical protein